jgi:hypothetical protein
MPTFDPIASGQLKREIVGVYDRAASLYDHVGVKSATYYANLLVDKLNIKSGARVLDVATGRGAFLFAAAEKVGANGLNRPELIEAALRESGFENISITEAETTMYFADEDDWWNWESSQGSRFWMEGMSPEGLAKFKAASFEKLKAMKTSEGIPILVGALLSVANAPVDDEKH